MPNDFETLAAHYEAVGAYIWAELCDKIADLKIAKSELMQILRDLEEIQNA